jgi:hypothetical protein
MKFGTQLFISSTKRRNSPGGAFAAKIALRKTAAAWVEEPRVLDLYAGPGILWNQVWKKSQYDGCDRDWFRNDPRRLWVADNLLLARALDLSRWNVFDLDAYGSPWRLWWIIAIRRQLQPGERVAVVFTDGTSMRARLGRIERHLAHLAGFRPDFPQAPKIWDKIVARAVNNLAQIHKAKLARLEIAHQKSVYYGAALLQGLEKSTSSRDDAGPFPSAGIDAGGPAGHR